MTQSYDQFRSAFGRAPSHLAEAPGRVNLVGDHTDYNDLPVLPVALAERVRVWLSPRSDSHVRMRSQRWPESLEDVSIEGTPSPRAAGDWRNYVRAAVAGAGEVLPRGATGFDGLVVSDLPPASGLSSSSALVVAVLLALLRVNDVEADPIATATLAARAEKYVGTAGGGMDQAAALCGKVGHALRIDFAPLRVEPVSIPEDWSFIVAFSGETAEKSGSAQRHYNERVSSCHAALDALGEAIGVDRALSYPALMANVPFGELLPLAERVLDASHLPRFRHTVTEAHRVDRAVEAMRIGDLVRFGEVMSASHASLRDDYEVSTPTLDRIVLAAQGAGAAGARLTGAGFGGSVVALARAEAVEHVSGAMQAALPPAAPGQTAPSGAGRVFRITPSGGADFMSVG